jgi:GT2 family glycosyltransferase
VNETEKASRAVIAPIDGSEPRPRWSVMIPTYNCARYLRDTLVSVLSQDPGPELMQIEVIDDHSTSDDPQSVVEELGRGRVAFYRQPRNVGNVRNFDTCLRRARGELVHLLHGDDAVLPGFYAQLERAFTEHPQIGAAFCRHIFMDDDGHWQFISPLERRESGILENWLETVAVEGRLQTPSVVVRRSVYEHLGGFDARLTYTEDWEMCVRIAAHYPVWYEVELLALYRMTSLSHSKAGFRTGRGAQDLRRTILINRSSLPESRGETLTKQALQANALAMIRRGHELIVLDDLEAARLWAREALITDRSPRVVRAALGLAARTARAGWRASRKPPPRDPSTATPPSS